MPGVVWEVFVKIGDKVKKGDPLFRLDDRELPGRAARCARRAWPRPSAQFHKLEAAPRAEDIPPAEAAVEEARAKVNDAETAMGRTEKLYQRQMAPASDYDKDRFAYYVGQGGAGQGRRRPRDGSRPGPGRKTSRSPRRRSSRPRARSRAPGSMLDRLTVRALADGEVLQVNVRPGQFAAHGLARADDRPGRRQPAPRPGRHRRERRAAVQPRAPARSPRSRGGPQVRFPLEFVKVEPYVIPKKSLTGDNTERVDTRVLQVIYALPDERPIPVYVGQQMDVYLEAAAPPRASRSTPTPPDSPLREREHLADQAQGPARPARKPSR